jgi:hypothetical protein
MGPPEDGAATLNQWLRTSNAWNFLQQIYSQQPIELVDNTLDSLASTAGFFGASSATPLTLRY